MGRWCYCSKILPGKSDLIREQCKKKSVDHEPEFWQKLKMTGFECWLQSSSKGHFVIHCLEGESLKLIFSGLREQIVERNPSALKLQNFYLTCLGKNYSLLEAEPHVECLLDIALPKPEKFMKRAFLYPLLSHKENDHRHFNKEAMNEKKWRHEAMMHAFGVFHLSTWIQTTPHGKYIVVYSERHLKTPSSEQARLNQGDGSEAWREIADHLVLHTGLKKEELSPDVEWMTPFRIF